MFFFVFFFFYLLLPSQQRRTCLPCCHHSMFTSHSPMSHQKHKMSPNDVQQHCLGSKYVFFWIFFYLVLPPQQCCLHRHHFPFISHSPTSHQQHKTSLNNVQQCCLDYKYVFSFVFFLLLISANSAVSPMLPPLSIDLLLPKITSET